ncbi:MAG: GspH/FimT family pseudopilin [Paraburkholderia tropica]|uniref:Type II secretion system protein H n=1 Tax=Paraburkholderia tropica TaxID=92647 RepID=A0ABX5MMY9_9BURK|nr:GspH/FimT family pseudopilin [Paraburkholderia tropica]MDE1143319.1 GspH/FimT family pseudopilin [Paraburkholderia tropica]PXX14796.1 type IV fimbrial biogenesis protein FimT [Paraburkholderia tropica]PZW80040.1 type IV fimbrial biogenesis protein FimT [Paraburkholderia tropica]
MKFAGFTLLETMAVIVLFATCVTAAVPTFAAWRMRDQVDARANALLGTFSYARSEAIRRKTRITVCRIDAARRCLATGKACPSGLADWSCGWAVVAEQAGANVLLRAQPALDEIAIASTLTALTFTPPAGQTIGSLRNFDIAPRVTTASTRSAAWRRCLRVAAGGRARVSEGACGAAS